MEFFFGQLSHLFFLKINHDETDLRSSDHSGTSSQFFLNNSNLDNVQLVLVFVIVISQ